MSEPTPPERELVALLELSEMATPGIWEMYGGTNHGRVQTADVIVCDGSPPHFMGKEDAKFIAALVNWFRQTSPTLPGAGGGDALDARRYRWLRDNDMFDPASQPPELARAFSRYTGSALDAAIDAATTPPPAELGKGS